MGKFWRRNLLKYSQWCNSHGWTRQTYKVLLIVRTYMYGEKWYFNYDYVVLYYFFCVTGLSMINHHQMDCYLDYSWKRTKRSHFLSHIKSIDTISSFHYCDNVHFYYSYLFKITNLNLPLVLKYNFLLCFSLYICLPYLL